MLKKPNCFFFWHIVVKIHYLGTHSFQREPLNSWNLGPGYQIAQQWAKERAADSRARTTIDNLSIFYLPVGVRAPEELKDGISSSHSQQQDSKTEDDDKALPLSSLSALTGASFEAVRDFYSNASTLLKGKTADAYKKQGLLSTRAASMLVIYVKQVTDTCYLLIAIFILIHALWLF